jgi:pilus assembly protein CpaF
MWEQARAGRPPDADLVVDVARQEVGALGARRVRESVGELSARVLGAGPLDPWLDDPMVTDVGVNGDGRIWVDRGGGLEWVGTTLPSDQVRALAIRLAGVAGRRLDEASPWVDGQLPSGARLHAVLPPLVAGGAHITLRIPAREHLSLERLAHGGMFPLDWVPLLRRLVAARRAFVVSGGTGAGKTTLLAALLGAVDAGERLLIIEDVRELHVDHAHVVRLEGRPPNVEGVGEVTLTTLVRQALRMRPDRIVVGEVRGAEVRELLAALNTGHEGGCGTVHANAAEDVIARFEALGALAGLGPQAVRVQVASAFAIVLHVARSGGHRRLATIGALDRSGPVPVILPAASWDGKRSVRGPGWSLLEATLGPLGWAAPSGGGPGGCEPVPVPPDAAVPVDPSPRDTRLDDTRLNDVAGAA